MIREQKPAGSDNGAHRQTNGRIEEGRHADATCGAPAMTAPEEAPPDAAGFSTVTYVEVVPPAAGQAASVLATYRDATRRDGGAIEVVLLQRIDRPNQFT